MTRTAVILFNLGGPDSKESIEPFLMNFFLDPNIVRLPAPFRWLLAKLISKRRSKREAGSSYGELSNKSPLLENSRAQASALEKTLGPDFKIFVCMRYWHPMADEIAAQVKNWNADRIILLPLYPQFSTTTTWSSLGAWEKAAKAAGLHQPVSTICCYPLNEGFIQASADNIRILYQQAQKEGHKTPRILFSAHGLPESIIKDGDPYQWQCKQTAEKIVQALGIQNLDWVVCYQSRVGRQKWIGPSTEEELERAADQQVPVILYPHAFTQEHVETLVELDIEYRHLAEEAGIPGYYRAATVSTHPAFIEGLAKLVQDHLDRQGLAAEGFRQICPAGFERCCMKVVNG